MKKKKILGTLAVAGLATVALASCGKKKDKIYTIGVNAGTGATGVEAGTSYDVKDAAALVEALKSVTPSKKGYVFKGWYTTATYTTKLEAGVDISNVTTIFAKWEKADFTVTFDVKGNAHSNTAANTTTDVQFEDTVSPPNKDLIGVGLTENGSEMTFKGWALEDGTAFTADTPITGNTTIKAVWEIVKIDTPQKFADYVNNEQTSNAEITANIDMTGTLISRKAADYEEGTTAIKDGSELVTKFSNKIYGLDHTISNLKFESDLKNGGLWAKLGDGAAFSDITFKDCEFKGTKDNSAFIAGRIDKSANVSFNDVVFEDVTLNTAKYGSAFVALSEGAKVTYSGIYVSTNPSTCGNNTGLLLGIAQNVATELEFTDCLVDGAITGEAAENVGLYVGEVKADANVKFTGCVAQGSIKAKKNVGAFIGDAKKEFEMAISFDKCIVTDANFEIVNGTLGQVNVFIGQIGDPKVGTADYVTSYGNSVYREYGVSLVTNVGVKNPDQAEAIMNADITKPSDNFEISIDDTTKTLSIGLKDTGAHTGDEKYTIEATKDPTIVDITTSPSVKYDTTNKTATVQGEKITLTSPSLEYVYAVAAGKSGNAIKVNITAPSNITSIDGSIVTGSLTKITKQNTTISGYIFVTEEEYNAAIAASTAAGNGADRATIEKKITIQWYVNAENAAKPVEYQIVISGLPASLPQPITAGNITSEDSAITAATDTTNNTKLNVTAGTVAYDTTNNGNFITVKIAKPTAVASTANVEVTGSSAKVLEKGTDSITVQLKVAKGDNGITVNWDKTQYDVMNYVVNVADAVTLEAKPTTSAFAPVQTVFTEYSGTLANDLKINDYVTLFAGEDSSGTTKSWSVDSNSKSLDGWGSWTKRLKSGGSIPTMVVDLRGVTGDKDVTLTLLSMTGSSSDLSRTITCTNKADATDTSTSAGLPNAVTPVEFTLKLGNVYTISFSGGINIYCVDLK